MPSLGVAAKGWEKSKEICVLGLAADLNPEARSGGDECVGALNEMLAAIMPDRPGLGALEWIVASDSTDARDREDRSE